VILPYALVAVVLVVLAVVLARFPLPAMGQSTSASPRKIAPGCRCGSIAIWCSAFPRSSST
jgi:hypothetical protein